jgi:transcriptional regulator with GAF, ATPase, and Fis domain
MRRDDIPLLVWSFVNEFATSLGKTIDSISAESMDGLARYAWPGNVRELRNVVERAVIVSTGPRLHVDVPNGGGAAPLGLGIDETERSHILGVLEMTGWRIRGAKGAAEMLALKPTTLEARMIKLGIRRPRP